MKKIVISAILLLVSLSAQERSKWEFKSAPGKSLEVDMTTQYDITVTGWDKDLILVESDIEKGDDEEESLNFHHTNGNLKINSGFMDHGGSELNIRVPKTFDLDLATMGGDIRIENIEGEIVGKTMGGDLEFFDLKGSLEFTTMGGDVEVYNALISGELKTMGGDLDFENVAGTLKASTMGGDVSFRSSKKDMPKKDAGELQLSTMGGDIRVDSAPMGVSVNTMGGDIIIRSAGKYVKANTMGGDIDINEIDGSIKATTMGGEVNAQMVGDPDKGDRDVKLSSMGGSIRLTVPAGLSMDFDIKLTYTKQGKKQYTIQSDFPITLKESESWDYSQGSPKKYIFGSGQVAGGKNKIKIETINGDIVIKKGSN
jgi:DUF4097 and DUF4098 domain-containing protein YvlB